MSVIAELRREIERITLTPEPEDVRELQAIYRKSEELIEELNLARQAGFDVDTAIQNIRDLQNQLERIIATYS